MSRLVSEVWLERCQLSSHAFSVLTHRLCVCVCVSVCMYMYKEHPNFQVRKLKDICANTSPLSLPSSYGRWNVKTLGQSCFVFLTVVGACEKCSVLNKQRTFALLLQSKHHGSMSLEVL